jgi:hypothetical protein
MEGILRNRFNNCRAATLEAQAQNEAERLFAEYENQGSQPGHEVQHWLKAEADLIAERNLTRVHGFHNQT